jgi:hypothetical protein
MRTRLSIGVELAQTVITLSLLIKHALLAGLDYPKLGYEGCHDIARHPGMF